MKYSTRGWCYIVEGLKLIDKDEFDVFERAFNDCRRLGFLPIDFVAEDKDRTRRFDAIQPILSPSQVLDGVSSSLKSMLTQAPSRVTDYWAGERYYPIMVVEKGDIRNLFESICREYHVPIASSKGWAPLHLRNDIVELAKGAEKRGMTPVLLLCYDHDPAGIKITEMFRKSLRDIQGATGWDPSGLVIERYGLNQKEIEECGLTWIPNLKTSSGKVAIDPEYVAKFGNRKCESNALFRNDETVLAGEGICRRAIEKYLDDDALDRFRVREEESRKKLNNLYSDPLLGQVESSVTRLKSQLG